MIGTVARLTARRPCMEEMYRIGTVRLECLRIRISGELIVSRYVAESITTDAGHSSHVGLCQLRTKTVFDSATYLLTISSPVIDNVAMSLYNIIKNKEYEGIRGWSIS